MSRAVQSGWLCRAARRSPAVAALVAGSRRDRALRAAGGGAALRAARRSTSSSAGTGESRGVSARRRCSRLSGEGLDGDAVGRSFLGGRGKRDDRRRRPHREEPAPRARGGARAPRRAARCASSAMTAAVGSRARSSACRGAPAPRARPPACRRRRRRLPGRAASTSSAPMPTTSAAAAATRATTSSPSAARRSSRRSRGVVTFSEVPGPRRQLRRRQGRRRHRPGLHAHARARRRSRRATRVAAGQPIGQVGRHRPRRRAATCTSSCGRRPGWYEGGEPIDPLPGAAVAARRLIPVSARSRAAGSPPASPRRG